jgi:hypothetical protein
LLTPSIRAQPAKPGSSFAMKNEFAAGRLVKFFGRQPITGKPYRK